ncbi:MAG: TonB-dependent receptor [Sulfurospirillaceae bacterium]|nr:TonB-dependent receptor [Sulfurospirillaceae bacterium]
MKCPKGFRGKYFSLAAILALNATVTIANETQSAVDIEAKMTPKEFASSEEETPPLELIPVVVVSKKIKVAEIGAPFASEVYTKKEIEKSHSKDIYEFLNSQTSVFTIPSSGNSFSQKIDLRGFGIEDGYESVVVTLNGRRLNNIDLQPQLLSNIPLDTIKQIEIIKGSGSVEYGDGANAGVINIITQDPTGVALKTYGGSNGVLFGSASAGVSDKYFSISAYMEDYSKKGQKQIATDGQKDESDSTHKSFSATLNPTEEWKLNLGKSFTKQDTFYPNALTMNEYKTDPNTIPAPIWGSLYGHQKYDIELLTYGSSYKLSDTLSVDFQGSHEDKVSDYVDVSKYNYDNDTHNAKILYSEGALKAVLGVQHFEGIRKKGAVNTTTKENMGYFAKADITQGNSTFSLGGRTESVDYSYHQGATHLEKDKQLEAFDIGYNYKLNAVSSLFINYNQSFQAPDIDRFFDAMTGTFNGFIDPMEVKTINAGYSYLGSTNKFKLSAFYASINDEIYYDNTIAPWGANSNLDKTRKIGFEIYDKYMILHNLYTSLNYAYVDTKIVSEGDGTLDGKEIPGVSHHNVKLSLGYNPTHQTTLVLVQNFKSKAYAMSDFLGVYGKMENYNTTDLSATYTYKNYEFFAKVSNIFDKKNALFVNGWSGLGVYPTNYEREFMLGMSAKF